MSVEWSDTEYGTAFCHDERCLWHTTGEAVLVMPVGGWLQPNERTLDFQRSLVDEMAEALV